MSSLIAGGSTRMDSLGIPPELLADLGSVASMAREGSTVLKAIQEAGEGGGPGGLVQELLHVSATLSSARSAASGVTVSSGATGIRGQLSEALSSGAGALSMGGIADAWAAAVSGQAGGIRDSVAAAGAGQGRDAGMELPAGAGAFSEAMGSLKGAVSSGAAMLSENVVDGAAPQWLGGAAAAARRLAAGSMGSLRSGAGGVQTAHADSTQGAIVAGETLQPAATAASSAGGDATLAQTLEAIEQRFAFVEKPLTGVGGLNMLQRALRKLESWLEELERAVPFAAVPIGFVQGRVEAVSTSHVINVIVTNWGHLQPEWMKAMRIWVSRVRALWARRDTRKVKVFRVNADWQNSAVQ